MFLHGIQKPGSSRLNCDCFLLSSHMSKYNLLWNQDSRQLANGCGRRPAGLSANQSDCRESRDRSQKPGPVFGIRRQSNPWRHRTCRSKRSIAASFALSLEDPKPDPDLSHPQQHLRLLERLLGQLFHPDHGSHRRRSPALQPQISRFRSSPDRRLRRRKEVSSRPEALRPGTPVRECVNSVGFSMLGRSVRVRG